MPFLLIPIVFGFVGGFWGKSKGLNPVLWGLICGLLPVIGVLILAFQKGRSS